jgi:protein disulfide-isomerase A6
MKLFKIFALFCTVVRAEDDDEDDIVDGEVITLTDKNFNRLVMEDEKNIWFIKFYAPWCGHCKNMEPTWEELAKDLKGRVKIARVDCTQETVTANKFGIQGFPTLKLFPPGPKSVEEAVPYESGGRDASSLNNFVMEYYAKTVEADQLLNNAQFEETCESGLCILAFLPHLFDCQSECRKAYIKNYNTAIQSKGATPARYLWLQGGDNFEFEEKLNLGFGYPAVIAVHKKKGKFGVHRGNMEHSSISGFITSLMSGKVPLNDLPKELPKLYKSEPWDGKDMEMPKEEL